MKILIIGLGSIGKKHVEVIRSILPKVEIIALRSRLNSPKISDVINIFDVDELASIKIDFAIISNPTSEHKRTIAQLIKYNIPLFIEKPLYYTLDINDLINSIKNNKILTYVACNLRFLDCLMFVKNQLSLFKSKRLNEVNVYCGSYLPDWRSNSDYREIYSSNAKEGGGVHLDLIHELDYLYWFFGMPKFVNRYFKNQSSLSISAIDYANYLLEFEGFCVNVVLNYYRRDPRRSLDLVFEDESWNVDLLKNQVTCNEKVLYSSNQCIADTYYLQMQYFINCLNDNKMTFNTVNNAFEVLKICLEK